MNKNLTETMGKKTYQKPQAEALRVEAESILAASGEGEITGTGSDMGWDNGESSGTGGGTGGDTDIYE